MPKLLQKATQDVSQTLPNPVQDESQMVPRDVQTISIMSRYLRGRKNYLSGVSTTSVTSPKSFREAPKSRCTVNINTD